MLDIFKKAKENKYAIGAFNASNLEGIRAIAQAARKFKKPVIIATSSGEKSFIGGKQIRAAVDVWKKETGLPIILHLDHGKSFEIVKEAINDGYDSVHFDGSELSFEENADITKKVVKFAKNKGVLNVEGEMGYLRGGSILHEEAVEIKEDDLTVPSEALKFVEETGVNTLAIAIGNIHGIICSRGKNNEIAASRTPRNDSAANPHLFLGRLKEINDCLGDKAFLCLHGGSGTPEEDIKKAVGLGIVKININTELRMAYTKSLKEFLQENPNAIKPHNIMEPVVEAVQKVVENKIRLFSRD
ncbi:MAG: class II fructose-bisphosphate aldolase [Patescibacteria group bacterium]|nr:class II fructose-bisphosphate aldolase [Patescibacteria group bacterium]